MKSLLTFCFLALSSISFGEIIYEVDDDLEAGTIIGNPALESRLENLSKLTFIIPKSLLDKYLEITDKGELKTISILDRDAIPECEGLVVCEKELEILVGPSQYFRSLTVTIKIKDRNDNNPVFPQESHEWRLVENSPINTRHLLPSAIDKDAGDYGRLRYELTDKSDEFRLEINGNDLELVLMTKLDREEQDEYKVTVKVTDGGGRSALLRVLVVILDTNDHRPQFSKQIYIKTISEDFNSDSSVLRVVATDKDQGENGRIGYKFSKQTDESVLKTFRLDETTGTIWTKTELDYESISNYKFSIEAKDYGDNSIAAYTKVQIEVTDVNDHFPEIFVNSLNKKDAVEVSENSTTDTFVAYITVTDKDSGENSRTNCILNSDDSFKLVHLHSSEKKSEYELSTNSPIGYDREDKEIIDVKIICQDSGRPSKSTSKTIKVTILDENDNPPKFEPKYYSKRIEEDNNIGIYLLTVTATDSDAGVNGEISYSIPDISSKRYVTINKRTGDIFASAKFDREREETFNFRVMAHDKGKPSLSSYAIIDLHLKDVNDNPPIFTDEEYYFTVYENSKTPTYIGKVTAVDADAPPFDTVDYVIDADTTADFRIDRMGRIYSERSFDRELQTSHVIKVRAFNADKPEMHGIAQVRIDVRDANDNHPIIDYPNDQNNSVDLSNYSKLGKAVTRIRATDKDEGKNAELRYVILKQKIPDAFYIEPETGVLIVNKDLKGLAGEEIEIRIRVSDSGIPTPLFVDANITVRLYEGLPSEQILDTETRNLLPAVIVIVCIAAVLVVALIFVIILIRRKKMGVKREGDYKCTIRPTVCNAHSPTEDIRYVEHKYPLPYTSSPKRTTFDLNPTTIQHQNNNNDNLSNPDSGRGSSEVEETERDRWRRERRRTPPSGYEAKIRGSWPDDDVSTTSGSYTVNGGTLDRYSTGPSTFV